MTQLPPDKVYDASPTAARRSHVPPANGHVVCIGEGHPLREEAERLVERVYAQRFEAHLFAHFPLLLSLLDGDGSIVAVAGVRFAARGPLFLEHYLEAPVETVVSGVFNAAVSRDAIAEIGSLAADSPCRIAVMFRALAAHLDASGVTIAAATATRKLRRVFATMNFEAQEIAPATIEHLPQSARAWGSYYAHDPVVVAGRVAAGMARRPVTLRIAS